MAPATRSRQASGVNKKAPVPKRRTRSTKEPADWDFMPNHDDNGDDHHGLNGHSGAHRYNGGLVVESREPADVDDEFATGAGFSNTMHEMAERVGREVEEFAMKLDQFLETLPTRNKFHAVLDLVDEFQEIAQTAEATLQKSTQHDRAQQLRREWGEQMDVSAQTSSFKPRPHSSITQKKDSVAEMRQWQQEVDIWELFKIVLECHHNPDLRAVEEAKEDELRAMPAVHRYTSEIDIWRRFLIQDDVARWRSRVKEWLEHAVEHQESEVPEIVEELEARAGRGQGLWSSGWMQTRERIKGQKRLRPWPTTPGVALPHIQRSDNSELLVTSLDPDAISRQDRTLEKADAYSERAMWITCWEMLRRGVSWQAVSEWCKQRDQNWRAISIGKAMSPTEAVPKSTWRHMCYLASQDSHASDYEAAVYGLLGGSVKAVQRVAHNVDDNIYAHYNAALICQFEQHLSQNYPALSAKFRRSPLEDNLRDPGQQIVDLVLSLRKHSTTSQESVKPMKMLQSYLMANDLGSLVNTLGHVIGRLDAQRQAGEDMILHLDQFWSGTESLPEETLALHPQALRIVAHIALLMRALAIDAPDVDQRDAEENVTVAYIQSLRAAGKRDLIPTYAARLSGTRYVITMSRVFEDISSVSEQATMLSLLAKNGMDGMQVVNEQLWYLLNKHIAPSLRSPRPLRMLEDVEDTHRYPGQRIIAGFLPEHVTTEDDAILRAVQWYSIIEGHWADTFKALAFAVRKCLVAGKLACALSIVHEFPYESLSVRKTYQTIGRSINLMELDSAPPAGEEHRWNRMREQSRTYYELQTVVEAIQVLSEWREMEVELEAERQSPMDLGASTAPRDLKEVKFRADMAMEPILTGNILRHGQHLNEKDDEAADLRFIRTRYIPELVIAYNTVLHTAGGLISRENLIQSMDLSVTVADEQNHLSECFVEAGRMRELVTSFAQTSKAMLVLKGAGKNFKQPKNGKDLSLWEPGQMHGGERVERNREVSL